MMVENIAPKVVLVRPHNIYGMQNYPPLGLVLLGSALEDNGFQTEILINNTSAEDFDQQLLDTAKNAMFVAFTATTAEVQDAIRLAQLLRKSFGMSLPLIWGGWHPTLFPEQMRDSDLVDYAIVGEGERCIVDVANFYSGKGNPDISNAKIPNLELVGKNKLRSKIMKDANFPIDELPTPNYFLVKDIEHYITRPLTDIFEKHYDGQLRWLPYESSRGCPYHCSFCINEVTDNNRYRPRSAKKVASDLIELVSKHRLTHVKIIDDLFFVKIKRVREIFTIIEQSDIKFTWDAECRVDYIRDKMLDDSTFELLKANGLVQLTFGIESGSEDTLKRMQKGGRAGPEYAIRAIEACARHGISSRGSFIVDSPGDTQEDLFKTVRLIRKLRPYPQFSPGVHTYRPYPKSPLCEELLRTGKFYQPDRLEDWQNDDVVKQFTSTSVLKRWLPNWKVSSKISFYESLESGFWLKEHMLRNPALRMVNNCFCRLAQFRNRTQWYSFSVDRPLYIWFKDKCIKNFAYEQSLKSYKGSGAQGLATGGFWGGE